MTRSYYDDEQRFWDEKGSEDYVSLSAKDQQRIFAWIGWAGPGRILDLGGGAGMMSRLLMNIGGTECVCIDISHKMLAHARVPAVQGDALKLPFADQSFDLVVAAAFFHHLPGQEAALYQEIARILKPNGKVVGYDPSALCLQNKLFMGETPFRLSTFSPDERPIHPVYLAGCAKTCGLAQFSYNFFSFNNTRLTIFEFIQRFFMNPLAKGPLRPLLSRWFFWKAGKI